MHAPAHDPAAPSPDDEAWPLDGLVLHPGPRADSYALPGRAGARADGAGETVLFPSGGDDARLIQAALVSCGRVRLAPEVFTLRAPLTLPHAAALVGSGSLATELRVEHEGNGIMVHAAASGVAVEALTLTGPGRAGEASGIVSTRGAEARAQGLILRDVAVTDFGGHGIDVLNTAGVELSGVVVRRVGRTGVRLRARAPDVVLATLRKVRVEEADAGVSIAGYRQTVSENVLVRAVAGTGFRVAHGSGHALRSVVVRGGTAAIVACDTAGLSLHACAAQGAAAGFRLTRVSQAAVDGCRAISCPGCSLEIGGGVGVTVAAFLSDQRAGTADSVHLVVAGGAAGVVVTSLQRLNPAGPPVWEADVSAAGGRVVFIQHDLDPAKVNAGGNFAQL
jgi:hypothetical protein